ncbi:unnamed protein product [Haemonchus placei]|uniref:Aa_trans domain-containing protein n=1 Tax=Haemonchus placei TaxID=6290 RepID=A0A0N4X9U0_HAEPC|nr:unnamed protein product [Haemonchus placei]
MYSGWNGRGRQRNGSFAEPGTIVRSVNRCHSRSAAFSVVCLSQVCLPDSMKGELTSNTLGQVVVIRCICAFLGYIIIGAKTSNIYGTYTSVTSGEAVANLCE